MTKRGKDRSTEPASSPSDTIQYRILNFLDMFNVALASLQHMMPEQIKRVAGVRKPGVLLVLTQLACTWGNGEIANPRTRQDVNSNYLL